MKSGPTDYVAYIQRHRMKTLHASANNLLRSLHGCFKTNKSKFDRPYVDKEGKEVDCLVAFRGVHRMLNGY